MTRYEIQDKDGECLINYGYMDDDEYAIGIIGFMVAENAFAKFPRPLRLVRIEEETPQEADTARLDWLGTGDNLNSIRAINRQEGTVFASQSSTGLFPTLDAAIDYARGYAPKTTVIKEYTHEQ